MQHLEKVITRFDSTLLDFVRPHGNSAWTALFQFISDSALFFAYGIPIALIITGLIRNKTAILYRGPGILLVVLFANYTALILRVYIGWHTTAGGQPGGSGYWDFPSVRTVGAVTLAATTLLMFPKSYYPLFLVMLALVVGFSRIYLGVFNPSEIIGTILYSGVLAVSIFAGWQKVKMG